MKKKESLVIIGAGGHARVIDEAAQLMDMTVTGCIASSPSDMAVLGNDRLLEDTKFVQAHVFILGFGDLQKRKQFLDQHGRKLAGHWQNIIHPAAIISKQAHLGAGVFIAAGSIVQTAAKIGDHCILNTGSIVEHDVNIGQNCHIAPGAILTGGVMLADDVFVGAGAVVTNAAKVMEGAFIKAHAVFKS